MKRIRHSGSGGMITEQWLENASIVPHAVVFQVCLASKHSQDAVINIDHVLR